MSAFKTFFRKILRAAQSVAQAIHNALESAGLTGVELNKIVAAVLVAGIIAMFAGFIATTLTARHHGDEKVVLDIDTSALETAGAGAAAGPVGPEPVLALLAGADVKRGEQLSKACTACHTFTKDGKDGVGPNQWNLVMAPKAHRDGFAYSDALKALHGKGEKWTYSDLNHFIWKPQATVPGTKMNYLGLKKPEDRAALIAYLRTLSDNPTPLPSDQDIQTEQAAYDAAQPKKADAPAADAKDATLKDAPKATDGKVETEAAPSSDPSSSAAPLENSAPAGVTVKKGDSAVPASQDAVPPAATP